METTALVDVILGQGVWACLFVYLFINSREEAKTRENLLREESKEREKELTNIIAKHSETLADITTTLKLMNQDIEDIKDVINVKKGE